MENILPFLSRKEFIAIAGPRQAGKTTFLEILKTYLINKLKIQGDLIQTITFENRILLSQFEMAPVSFIHSFIPSDMSTMAYLMIDEFQYAAEGGQKLKLIYDTLKGVKIFITGSSSLDIKAQVGKYMVGRMFNFYLYPFNFGEYLRGIDTRLERIYSQKNQEIMEWLFEGKELKVKNGSDIFSTEMIKHYEHYCMWGGYPSVVLTKDLLIRKKLLSDIYSNYILKDIKTLLELATEKNLFLLSQYLATQIGNIVVYQNLSQASNLDHRQLKKHLNILDETYICKEVRPFFKNRQKELSKNPKIFFIDMGFRNHLLENMSALDKRADTGAIVENTVFIRLHELFRGIGKINFWRTKAGAEVDFVVNRKGNAVPIEVKFSPFIKEKISRSLSSFIDNFQPEYALVLNKNLWGTIRKDKTEVLFIPLYYV